MELTMTVGIDGPKLNMGRFVQDRMLNLRPCTVKDNVDPVLRPQDTNKDF